MNRSPTPASGYAPCVSTKAVADGPRRTTGRLHELPQSHRARPRPISANLLIRLAQFTDLDLKSFGAGEDQKAGRDLDGGVRIPSSTEEFPPRPENREFVLRIPRSRGRCSTSITRSSRRGGRPPRSRRRCWTARPDRNRPRRMASEQVTDLLTGTATTFPSWKPSGAPLEGSAPGRGGSLRSMAGYLETKHRVKWRC